MVREVEGEVGREFERERHGFLQWIKWRDCDLFIWGF